MNIQVTPALLNRWKARARELDVAFTRQTATAEDSMRGVFTPLDMARRALEMTSLTARQQEISMVLMQLYEEADRAACTNHKRYKGLRAPTCNNGLGCQACKKVYQARQKSKKAKKAR